MCNLISRKLVLRDVTQLKERYFCIANEKYKNSRESVEDNGTVHLSALDRKYQKFGPKNQNCQFKLKFGT